MAKRSILNDKENKGFFKKLNKKISKKTVVISGLLFVGFYIFMNTVFTHIFESRANNNPYIDLQIFNSPHEFYNLLSSYGSIGRLTYIQLSIGFDFIFPLIFSIFFIFIGIYLFRKISKKIIYQKIIFILAISSFLADWLENIGFIILNINYPTKLFTLFYIASTLTLIKTILYTICISIIIIGIIILIVKKLKKRDINSK